MIIHLDGRAEELLEFVKGMQFPIAHYAFGTAEEAENEADDQGEIDREVERMFAMAELSARDSEKKRMLIDLNRADWVVLNAMAEMRSMRGCDLAAEIITDWLARQKYLKK